MNPWTEWFLKFIETGICMSILIHNQLLNGSVSLVSLYRLLNIIIYLSAILQKHSDWWYNEFCFKLLMWVVKLIQMSPKVLAHQKYWHCPIEFHCKTVLNKVMPVIQFAWYHFGNRFDAHYGSLTNHIVNGIMLEKFLFDLHRVPKRANSFGTHFQCYVNGKIPF